MEGAEHYASAKVVVLGDPGVGKTALARALVGLPFVRTEPTHMRRVRKLADEVVAVDGLRVRRETLLWDLGQPGYPVLHRLALSGTDLALVVFDPERIEEPDHVGAWMQGLRLAQDHERTPRHIRTFLVAARVDRRARHTPPQLRKRILDLAGTLGVEGYFETSALTGAVSELRAAIRAAIPWQDMATFEMNDRTRAVIDKLRHRREQGDVVIDAPRLVAVLGDPELVVDRWTLRTAVAIEENRGRVHSMSRGGVLLRPRLLDQYAEALINAANAELNGLGTIADELARVGTFMQQFGNAVAAPSELTDEDALDPSPADERARDLAGRLVRAMIDELVDHGIALRVETADQSYLMLPSQLQPSREELAPVDDVSAAFAFDGDASRVFATLLVAVAYGSP
jgi:GTPase SAR1 family protein